MFEYHEFQFASADKANLTARKSNSNRDSRDKQIDGFEFEKKEKKKDKKT